jgi:5-methylcytosine-specific restriction endonuclease McrA
MIDPATRQLVRRRAADRCEYCRLPQGPARLVTFHVEHVTPKQHGGTDQVNNLAWACPHCNRFKGPNLTAVDPDTNHVVLLYNPRTESWDDHFELSGVQIIGLTPAGRATVRLLRMNDAARVKVREELHARGEL